MEEKKGKTESDFFAPITFDVQLPEYPAKERFMHIPVFNTELHKYEMGAIEMNRVPQIYTNYVLDQKIDLLNPQTYAVPDKASQKIAPEDTFLLSEPEAETAHGHSIGNAAGGTGSEKKVLLEADYFLVPAFHYTLQPRFPPGRKLQMLALGNRLLPEERKKVDIAIINKTFEDVKKFQVGTPKENNPDVTVKRVIKVQPFFEFLSNRMIFTIFDHKIGENLPEAKRDAKTPFNALFLMKHFVAERSRAFAIYAKTDETPLIQKTIPPGESGPVINLGCANYQYVREYDYFINPENQLRRNLMLSVKGDTARFIKPRSILKMNKKKKTEGFEEGSGLSNIIQAEARVYTQAETNYKNQKNRSFGCLQSFAPFPELYREPPALPAPVNMNPVYSKPMEEEKQESEIEASEMEDEHISNSSSSEHDEILDEMLLNN